MPALSHGFATIHDKLRLRGRLGWPENMARSGLDPENDVMVICKHAHYSGQVQGVGFRYTAKGLADGMAVAGFVRNLPDGSVELIAEGDAFEVGKLLQAVEARMAGLIDQCRLQDVPPSGLRGFEIRYS